MGSYESFQDESKHQSKSIDVKDVSFGFDYRFRYQQLIDENRLKSINCNSSFI